MGVTPRCRAIIAQLTLRTRRNPGFDKYIARVNRLLTSSYEPQDKRNRIIHDAWYIDQSQNQPAQFKTWPHKDLRFGINAVDFADIESTLKAIKDLSDRASAILRDVRADIEANK